jgi:hypothetical protein
MTSGGRRKEKKREKLNFKKHSWGRLNARERGLQRASVYWRRDNRTVCRWSAASLYVVKLVSGLCSQSDDWGQYGN